MHSTKRKTTEQFIEDAKAIHGDKYDYSKVEYENQQTEVCIVCPEHGEFWQKPKLHLMRHGCPECGKARTIEAVKNRKIKVNRRKQKSNVFKPNRDYQKHNITTTKDFIEYCDNLHEGKYTYEKTEFTKVTGDVIITCPKHGDFKQEAYRHLIGQGCPVCGREQSKNKQRITKEEFIKFSKEKYGEERFDYNQVEYVDYKTKVKIICPKHGEFWQTPGQHLISCGCKDCFNEEKRKLFAMSKEEFVKRSTELFHGKYGYDNVDYINNSTKVLITCPKHGDFPCTPANHLKGRGCPICKSETYVYEERLYNFLKTIFDEDDIIKQYRPEFLTNHKSLDFYIKSCNLVIEHQGSQHYSRFRYVDETEERFERRKMNDAVKAKECAENGVPILYFSYELQKVPADCPHDLILDEQELLRQINKHIKK